MCRSHSSHSSEPKRRQPRLKQIIFSVAAAAVLAFYYFADVYSSSPLIPKCPVYTFTGYDCPGCGLQRMIHSLLHADFAGAWQANAFLLCSLPFLAFMVAVDCKRLAWPRLYNALNSPAAIAVYAVAIAAWGIFRNIPF